MAEQGKQMSAPDGEAPSENIVPTETRLFQLVAGSKARLSVSVGILAGLIVAVGFFVFDLGREQYLLKQKYPDAAGAYERNILYARDLVSQGRCDKAIPLLRGLIDGEKGSILNADSLILLATCLETAEQDQATQAEARELYDRFIQEYPLDPRVPEVQVRIARNYARNGLYRESNTLYDKLLRQATDELRKGEIRFWIARNNLDASNFEGAIEQLREIRQQYAGTDIARDATLLLGEAYFRSGQTADAERVLQNLIRESSETAYGATARRMLADHALEAGEYREAVEYCLEWLRESPQTAHQVDVMLTLGRAKLALAEPSEAESVASDIIAFFPDSPKLSRAYVLRGQALEALGLAEDAASAYRYAADLDPEDPSPLQHLAALYKTQGNLDEAIMQLKLASRRARQDDSLLLELAKLYRLNGKNVNATEILGEFIKQRGLSSYIGEAHLLLCEIQLELGQPHQAYKTLDHLLAIGTSTIATSVPLLKQGDILASVGLYKDAADKYQEALELGTNLEDTAPKLVRSLLAADNPEECLRLLRSLDFKDFPKDIRFALLETQARAFAGVGKYQEARQSLLEAIALRSEKENFSTLALLMQMNLELKDGRAARKVYEATFRIINTWEDEAPSEARQIIMDWARHLYEQRAYAQAAEVYASVQPPRFPGSDVAWAVYQLGNCYYHMANFEAAQGAYARLAREFSGSEWVKCAEHKRKLIDVLAPT
ncbi:MAG: hypothetical protein Kow0099_05790 [Candidatus Abyssubacteria bacterium]